MLPLGLWNVSTEQEFHAWLTRSVFVLGIITFLATTWINAPYGRYLRSGWGPTVNARVGWVVMECPSAIWFAVVYLWGKNTTAATPMLAAALWLLHYTYRAFVYPFLIRTHKQRGMPLTVMLAGDFYNLINAYVNARYLSEYGDYADDTPWTRPSFYVGIALFATGMFINVHSDQILIHLRQPGETAYKIPFGGMFRYVSAPNYFGELLEWTGWSILAWSPAGLSFAVYTATNLVPRALSNHRWYLDKFKEAYPRSRRAILPFLL
ncbi:hypothetical protein P43SY_011481 [Pythium insidiosum]|uniref:3-oxo-5alpha-steroid 4-dehydrogenase (NADP(+)) n=1 Tax=Pythium insidiosum TaxID=114742 RepID=A0AAD5L8M7_PYTIN|nr:hypothetical protein P43SY_011481 [Pythium insidiosum]